MIENENLYNDIQKVLEDLPADFNILEEQIDIEDQIKYFEFSKKVRQKEEWKNAFKNRDELFIEDTPVERKKEILSSLASVADVKVYRTIERFLKQAHPSIKNWAVLAFQENRMLLQSSLLDEQQVFISTGLGGKGQKLRYYVVFINRSNNEMLNETQQKLLKDELIFALEKEQGEFESIDFSTGFSASLILLPVKAKIQRVFSNVIEECNQYGNFLVDDMIITNVKVLSRSEILGFLEQHKHDKKNN